MLSARADVYAQSKFYFSSLANTIAPDTAIKGYVIANFREDFLSHIRPGMRAQVYLIAYPGRSFRGSVQGVGWALHQENGATVEGLPQVEPTLNWVRLSQRFPVRIVLEKPDPVFPYRMGATAVVTIQGYPSSEARLAVNGAEHPISGADHN